MTRQTCHDKGTRPTGSGQNTCESYLITSTDPASGPDRNRLTTHSQNTWASWATGSAAGVVLHSVPPLLVFVAAEAVTDLRDKITDAVRVAVEAAGVPEPGDCPEPVRPRRRTFEEYRSAALRAWSPGVEITPTWVRDVTGCSRGLSSRLAATVAADVAGERS